MPPVPTPLIKFQNHLIHFHENLEHNASTSTWKDWKNPSRTSAKIACVATEIRTQHSRSLECYRYANLLGFNNNNDDDDNNNNNNNNNINVGVIEMIVL
jgi:hypothetical protein